MDPVISFTNSLLICHHSKQTATHKTQKLRSNGQDARRPEGHKHFVHMHMPHAILYIVWLSELYTLLMTMFHSDIILVRNRAYTLHVSRKHPWSVCIMCMPWALLHCHCFYLQINKDLLTLVSELRQTCKRLSVVFPQMRSGIFDFCRKIGLGNQGTNYVPDRKQSKQIKPNMTGYCMDTCNIWIFRTEQKVTNWENKNNNESNPKLIVKRTIVLVKNLLKCDLRYTRNACIWHKIFPHLIPVLEKP